MKKDSEEYRHLTECAFIMKLAFAERRPMIERIEKVRGRAAADRIKLTLAHWRSEQVKLTIEAAE